MKQTPTVIQTSFHTRGTKEIIRWDATKRIGVRSFPRLHIPYYYDEVFNPRWESLHLPVERLLTRRKARTR